MSNGSRNTPEVSPFISLKRIDFCERHAANCWRGFWVFHAVSVKDRCRLYCRVEQSSAYYLLKDKVIDGTSCGPDTDDICVNGICRPASCNHVLGQRQQLGNVAVRN